MTKYLASVVFKSFKPIVNDFYMYDRSSNLISLQALKFVLMDNLVLK